jgi:hypothetical protein
MKQGKLKPLNRWLKYKTDYHMQEPTHNRATPKSTNDGQIGTLRRERLKDLNEPRD